MQVRSRECSQLRCAEYHDCAEQHERTCPGTLLILQAGPRTAIRLELASLIVYLNDLARL